MAFTPPRTPSSFSNRIHLVQFGLIQHFKVLCVQVRVKLRAGLFAVASVTPSFGVAPSALGGGGRPGLHRSRQRRLDHAAGKDPGQFSGERSRWEAAERAEGQFWIQIVLIRVQMGIHVQHRSPVTTKPRWAQTREPDARVVVVIHQGGIGVNGREVWKVLGERFLSVTVSVKI